MQIEIQMFLTLIWMKMRHGFMTYLTCLMKSPPLHLMHLVITTRELWCKAMMFCIVGTPLNISLMHVLWSTPIIRNSKNPEASTKNTRRILRGFENKTLPTMDFEEAKF